MHDLGLVFEDWVVVELDAMGVVMWTLRQFAVLETDYNIRMDLYWTDDFLLKECLRKMLKQKIKF